jgi:hypothetical protein
MSQLEFTEAMRRIVTGDGEDGRSLIIVDGPPSGQFGDPSLGGLFEIWHEAIDGKLDPRDAADRGDSKAILSPDRGKVKVRWFVIAPAPPDAPREALNAFVRERFAEFGGDEHITDQSRHPAMHRTDTLDIICLISGDASLILDDAETRLKPGQIVIQRGTNHAWTANGGPALFLAVLIDRELHAAAVG